MDIENYLKSTEESATENVKKNTIQLQNIGLKEEGQEKVENITLSTIFGSIKNSETLVSTYDPEKQEDETISKWGNKVSISSTLNARIFCTKVCSKPKRN